MTAIQKIFNSYRALAQALRMDGENITANLMLEMLAQAEAEVRAICNIPVCPECGKEYEGVCGMCVSKSL